jgi:hypothetical protein
MVARRVSTDVELDARVGGRVRAGEAHERRRVQLGPPATADTNLRARRVELGAARTLRILQRDELVPDEVVARCKVFRQGNGDGVALRDGGLVPASLRRASILPELLRVQRPAYKSFVLQMRTSEILSQRAWVASNLSHVVPVHSAIYAIIGPTWGDVKQESETEMIGERTVCGQGPPEPLCHWKRSSLPGSAGATIEAGAFAPFPHARSLDVRSVMGLALCAWRTGVLPAGRVLSPRGGPA